MGGEFGAYSAAKAAGYAFRMFILRIRHTQVGVVASDGPSVHPGSWRLGPAPPQLTFSR